MPLVLCRSGEYFLIHKKVQNDLAKKKTHKITLHNKYKYNDSENLEGFIQHHSEMVKRNESMWSG